MQAAAQKWVDSPRSQRPSTCPPISALRPFKDVYAQAYATGCKGCTTYRPERCDGLGPQRAGSVAEDTPFILPKKLRGGSGAAGGRAPLLRSTAMSFTCPTRWIGPRRWRGNTYKLKWPDSESRASISPSTISWPKWPSDGPFEVFINSKEHGAFCLDRGTDPDDLGGLPARAAISAFVVEELKAVFDPRGGAWMEGEICALDPGGHRWRDRAAHDRDRLSGGRRFGAEVRP